MAAKFGGDAVSYAGVNPFSYFETSQKQGKLQYSTQEHQSSGVAWKYLMNFSG